MKPRSDSVLEGLPKNQRDALEAWLCAENISYDKAQERLRLDFGVKCSRSALHDFYQRVQQRKLKERIFQSQNFAREVEQKFSQNAQDFSSPLIQLIGQMAFENAVNGKEMDRDFFLNLSQLLFKVNADSAKQSLKEKALSLEERKVKLLEEKAARADRTEEVLKEELSPEEKQRKLKEIFHLA